MISAISSSSTLAEVCRKLNLKLAGSTYVMMRRHIKRLDVDISHFTGQAWMLGRVKSVEQARSDLLPRMTKNSTPFGYRRLIASDFKEAKCEECELTEWRGQPPPLQLDHIDGDRTNNVLDNLRILCANCHMLTETWGFKRRHDGLAQSGRRHTAQTRGCVGSSPTVVTQGE